MGVNSSFKLNYKQSECVTMNSHEAITQLNIDCYGCTGNLNNKDEIIQIVERAAKQVGARVLGRGSVSYPTRGITVVIFLAESHILVSTYPEYRYAIVEIFMCNSQADPYECWACLYDYLQPAQISVNKEVHYVGNGNGLALRKASRNLGLSI